MNGRRAGNGLEIDDNDRAATTRRSFLRRAGIVSAVTAAFVGAADVAGVAKAATSAKSTPRTPDVCICTEFWTYSPGHCNGGKPCPNGKCCFHVTESGPGCSENLGFQCLSMSCTNHSKCIEP